MAQHISRRLGQPFWYTRVLYSRLGKKKWHKGCHRTYGAVIPVLNCQPYESPLYLKRYLTIIFTRRRWYICRACVQLPMPLFKGRRPNVFRLHSFRRLPHGCEILHDPHDKKKKPKWTAVSETCKKKTKKIVGLQTCRCFVKTLVGKVLAAFFLPP